MQTERHFYKTVNDWNLLNNKKKHFDSIIQAICIRQFWLEKQTFHSSSIDKPGKDTVIIANLIPIRT